MTEQQRRRATLDDLQAVDLDQDEVELSGGVWVLVRALTRDEVAQAREANTDRKGTLDQTAQEYDLVSLSMLDPAMTPDDVAKWAQAKPAGDLVAVLDKVRELSRLGEDAHKSDLPGNRRERRSGARAAVRSRPRA